MQHLAACGPDLLLHCTVVRAFCRYSPMMDDNGFCRHPTIRDDNSLTVRQVSCIQRPDRPLTGTLPVALCSQHLPS